MTYITGKNGFLLSHLLPHLNLTDTIIHFGSPSCVEEFTRKSTNQMITDVENLLKLPHKNILFASSMGAIFIDNGKQQMYNSAKRGCEQLIQQSDKNYCVLRIPRVYGSDRKKGLMKYIKENKIRNYDTIISYIDIDDFVSQTLNKINFNCSIIYYDTEQNTIQEIKERYFSKFDKKGIT